MSPCHQKATAILLKKSVGANNGCSSDFASSEITNLSDQKRRAPREGLKGGRFVRHTTVDRFWARVQKHADGCWLFAGAKWCPGGHIYFAREDGSRVAAHRFSYELHHGPIPRGLVVMHTCDVARCVNPHHLQLGTQKDNIRDAMRKGRFSPWTHPNTVAAKHRRGFKQVINHAGTVTPTHAVGSSKGVGR